MAIDADLLAILACPSDDHAPLREETRDGADVLVCTNCATVYPIRDGIPVLLADDATPRAQRHRDRRPDRRQSRLGRGHLRPGGRGADDLGDGNDDDLPEVPDDLSALFDVEPFGHRSPTRHRPINGPRTTTNSISARRPPTSTMWSRARQPRPGARSRPGPAALGPGHGRSPGAIGGCRRRGSVGSARPGRRSAPRAVLVVTDASASVAGPVLAYLGGGQSAVLDWKSAELPRWAGPADALFAASIDGLHPRVATLLAEADRRGMTIVAVSPDDSPVAAAAGHGIRVAIDAPANRRAALWSLLTPLLVAGRALGVVRVSDDEMAEVAAGLDAVAEACRPDTDAFTNAAKQLAVEATESDLLIAGCGPMSSLAARWMTDSLALMAGLGALSLSLPDDVAQAATLLEIAPSGPAILSAEDFFRDRDDPPARRRRLVILPETGLQTDARAPFPRDGVSPHDLHELAAARAAGTLDDIASARGLVSSAPELPGLTPLARFAAATAFGDFTAAYAAIGRGIDPGAPRAGERP